MYHVYVHICININTYIQHTYTHIQVVRTPSASGSARRSPSNTSLQNVERYLASPSPSNPFTSPSTGNGNGDATYGNGFGKTNGLSSFIPRTSVNGRNGHGNGHVNIKENGSEAAL